MTETLLSRLGTAAWRRRHPEWATPPPGQLAPKLVISGRNLPRYAYDQAVLAVDRRVHGVTDRPWITAASMTLLDEMLRPTDRLIEFGSGGSTQWFARRVDFVYSVEAAQHWYDALVSRLKSDGVDNVAVELASTTSLGYQTDAHREAYVNAHDGLETASLDVVFVDGEYRDDCALRGLGLLRPGGMLVLDNANTYLPGPSRSPWRVDRPATSGWSTFLDAVSGWRHVWTTNGVWDTALWIKP